MAAGTILQDFAALIASSALPIAIWCRTDTSGESPSTSLLRCTSALARSGTRLAEDTDYQPHDGHWSMYHHRSQSVATTSCMGTKGHSSTYGVSPQQVETGQLLQRPDPAGPDGGSSLEAVEGR